MKGCDIMTTFIVMCGFLLILGSILVWGIRVQNQLVHSDELCGNALSQIGVQQSSRWDALTALADLTKGYSDHEYKAMLDIISARRDVGPQSSAAEAQQQEDILTQGFIRVRALAEAYPDLKANTVYIKTMDTVREYENNVRMSRMVFNDSVTKFNRLVRSFPSSVVASILRFAIRDYLQNDTEKSDMPSMIR
jgi:LemA protein